ncbi:uncharacterized protein LOC144106219 [Amblyomma americanum]
MHPRNVASLVIVGVFALTVILTVAIIYVPYLSARSRGKQASIPLPHTQAPEKIGGRSVFTSTLPTATDNSVAVGHGRYLQRPTGTHVLAAMVGLLVLWLLRASGLLLPALIAVSAVAALLLPLGRMVPAETGTSCGLSAICRLTAAARTNVYLRLDAVGLPAPYVRLLEYLLSVLETVDCDRVEDSCSRISLSGLLPF